MSCTANFHDMTWTTADRASPLTYAWVKSPSTTTPNVPVLNPRAWAPTTAFSTPPARPSQMRPNWSTAKL